MSPISALAAGQFKIGGITVNRLGYLPAQAKGSFGKLAIEQIDLWQLHRIDPGVPRDEQFATVQNRDNQADRGSVVDGGKPVVIGFVALDWPAEVSG